MAQESFRVRHESFLWDEKSEANGPSKRRVTVRQQLTVLLRKNLLVALREKICNGLCFILPIILGVSMLTGERATEQVESKCTLDVDAPIALPSSGWFRLLQTTYCSYILPCSRRRDSGEELYIPDQELSINFIIDELYRIVRNETLIRAWIKINDQFIYFLKRKDMFVYNETYKELRSNVLLGSRAGQLDVENVSVISSLSVKKQFLVKAVKTFIQDAKRRRSLMEGTVNLDIVFPLYVSAKFAHLLCDEELFDKYLVLPNGIDDKEKSRLRGLVCRHSRSTLKRVDLSSLTPQISEALSALTGLNTSIRANLDWVLAWTDFLEVAYHFNLFRHVMDAWEILNQDLPVPAMLATFLCGTSPRLSEIAEKHSWQNLASKWWKFYGHVIGKDIVLTPLSPVTKKIGDKIKEMLYGMNFLKTLFTGLFYFLSNDSLFFGNETNWKPFKFLGYAVLVTADNFQLLRNRSHADIVEVIFGNRRIEGMFPELFLSGYLREAVNALVVARHPEVKYMTKAVRRLTYGNVLAVISFTGVDSNSTSLPNATKYVLHIQQAKLSVQAEVDILHAIIQDMVNSAIIAVRTGLKTNVALYAQKFPRRCGNQTIVNTVIQMHTSVTLHTVAIWGLCLCVVVVNVVTERKMMFKEYCKTTGLTTFTYLVSWQLYAFILMHFSVTLYSVIMEKGAIVSRASPYAISLFIAVYSFAVAAQALAFANCFDSPSMAGLTVPVLYLLLRLLGGFVSASFFDYHVMIQALLSMFPQFGITIVINALVRNEERKNPFGLTSLFDPLYDYGSFSYSLLILMMLLGAIIHLFFAWYLLEIRSTSYNDFKRWYFPLQRSYWRPTYTFEFFENAGGDYLKQETLHFPVDLSVEHVSMCYGIGKKAKMALKDVSAEFYAGEVTALIGANSSGKTTLLSIMCGLFPPTKGDVVLLGESISSNFGHICSFLGYCPRNNVLLNKLTVAENLNFFGSLKGIPSVELRRDINEVLKIADLCEMRHVLVENSSDIVKRKLAIAIALLGNTKVIVIDEPTFGVDRVLRHAVWSMIFSIKKKRTVIFSTQYLDEAEILADRIAIISGGELKCSGSTGFLMANNKGGCFLTFVKKPQKTSLPEVSCVKKLISYLQSYVPDVEIVQNSHKEIEFKLPITDAVTLLNLVSEIDKSLESFGCTSYGFSEGGLEDVYRNETMPTGSAEKYVSFSSTAGIIEEHQPEEGDLQSFSLSSRSDESLRKSSPMNISVRNMPLIVDQELNAILRAQLAKSSGYQNGWIFQIKWMFQRRLIHFFRNWKMPFCTMFLPVLLAALCFHASNQIKSPYRQLRIVDIVQLHEPSVVFISLGEKMSANQNNTVVSLLNNMRTHGMGDQCTRKWCGTPFESNDFIIQEVAKMKYFNCKCVKHKVYCQPRAFADAIPTYKTRSGQVLVDLTGYSVIDWLTMTENSYSVRRHVGFSMPRVHNKWKRNYAQIPEALVLQVANKLYQLIRTIGLHRFANFITPAYFLEAIKVMETLTGCSQKYQLKVWYEHSRTMPYSLSTLYLPFGLNAVANAVLRVSVGSSNSPDKNSITTTIRTARRKEKLYIGAAPLNAKHCSGRTILEICGIALAASVLSASFALFVTEEHRHNSRQLQYTGGMAIWIYWLVMLIFDLCLITLTASLVFAISYLMEESFITSNQTLLITSFVCFIMFSSSAAAVVYLASNAFHLPNYACVVFSVVGITLQLFELVHHLNVLNMNRAARLVEKFTFFLPQQYFARSMAIVVKETEPYFQVSYSTGKVELLPGQSILHANEALWRSMNPQVCIFTAAIFLVMLFEYRHRICIRFSTILSGTFRPTLSESNLLSLVNDEQMQLEQRTNALETFPTMLRVANLEKVVLRFKCSRIEVDRLLEGLSFDVMKGECIGILGHEGAGKSLIFQLLTGNAYQTRGSVIINNRRPNSCNFRDIGYCPQTDSLDERLTVKETLRFYAAIRGMTLKETRDAIAYYGSKLYLDSCMSTQVMNLNACLKRRVSIAVAFIGSPPLVLLDEPTTGMDPFDTRCVHRIIINALNVGQSILFSTNTMEECEALCHRVIVLMKGRLLCMHSVQELKQRYARSYTLTVKLQPDHEFQAKDVKLAFELAIEGAFFKQQFGNNLVFEVPRQQSSLPAIFKAVLDVKRVFQFESYSLKLTPLESIIKEVAECSSVP